MQKFGIDVSRWQGDFNFLAAKEREGVEFAILKAGGSDAGNYEDSKFESFYKSCKSIGLPVGAYYFGRDLTVVDARISANHFVSLLAGKQFEYPVYYDVEGDMITKTDSKTLTDIILAFVDVVEKAGYWVGIYSSASFFNSEMEDKRLSKYAHWAAAWSEKPTLTSGNDYGIWQFGGSRNCIRSTQINGQTVDQNFCYLDYPSMIKDKGLNGFKNGSPEPTPEPVPTPANDKTLYRVQIGSFVIYDNAVNRYKDAQSKGFSPIIKKVTQGLSEYFRVQIGAFEVKQNAEAMLKSAKDAGYLDAYITTEDGEDICVE